MDDRTDRGPRWFELFVWGLVAVSLSIVVTSLIESAIMRYQGVKWEDVAHVGDFWGGHLNSLALAALALGLLYQKKLLDGQKQELERNQESLSKQLEAIENDTTQQSVHFLLTQLQEMSQRIEWLVTFQNFEGKVERIRSRGVRDLSYHLDRRAGQPDRIFIWVWPNELDEYIKVADTTLTELDKLHLSSQQMVKTVCDVLCPCVLRSFHDELSRKIADDVQGWVAEPSLPGWAIETLMHLSKRGFRIEVTQVGGGYQVTAFNELEGAQYSSGNTFCDTRDEALRALCERLR